MKAGYVDGFVLPVPTNKTAIYKKMAGAMAKLSKKHGAVGYVESRLEDATPKMMGAPSGMKYLPFMKLVKPKAGETVWFSFVMYKSRAHRDAVNKKIMKDP